MIREKLHSEVVNDITYSVVDMFLKSHSFSVLENRLLSSLKGELDSINVLRDVWLEELGGCFPERLVDVYERTNDHNGTQHYENLIDSILITFAAEFFIALLANIVADEYHENHDKVLRVIRRLYRKPAVRIVDELEELLQNMITLFGIFFLFTQRKNIAEKAIKHKPISSV